MSNLYIREVCEKILNTGRDIGSVIVFCNILSVYRILRGELSRADVEMLSKAVLGRELVIPEHRQLSSSGDVRSLIERDLKQLNLGYGDRFTRRIVYESPDREAAIKSFLRLKRLGFIVESKSGIHRVVGRNEASRIIREIEEGGESLDNIMVNSSVGWSEDDLLMEAETRMQQDLSSIDNKKLLKMLHARIRKGDIETSRAILREIMGRMNRLSSREVSQLAREVMRNPSIVSEDEVRALVERKPSLLSKLSKHGFKTRLNPRQPPGYYRSGYSRQLGGADASSIYLRRYAETGNPGYLDMWLSSLAVEGDDYSLARRVAESLESRDYKGLDTRVISRLYRIAREDAVIIMSLLLKDSSSNRLKRSLARMVFNKAKYGRREYPSRSVTTVKSGGRIDKRLSIYRMTRLSLPLLAYRVKSRKPSVALLVDTSGSLRNYSSEVVLYSSVLKNLLDVMIVFSDRAKVFRCSGRTCDPSIILGKIDFSGNTNIVNALERASAFRARKIIVITDLKHNMGSIDDLVRETRKLLVKRRRVVYLVVGEYDRRVLSSLADVEAKVVVADSYRSVIRALYREMVSS
ncbi:MAG: VWA domain-containing protein [Desulfurococcales archaeon]|nr:VWA domain-containing protein [Desulfurococcales archaeon]